MEEQSCFFRVITWMLLLTPLFQRQSSACNDGWFGRNCEYMCHCQESGCDTQGNCQTELKCVTGWFGPSCQYKNLVAEHGISDSAWLIDENPATCSPDGTIRYISISFKEEFHFSWLRLVHGHIDNFVITFNNNTQSCQSERIYAANSHELDVICVLSSYVRQISVAGELVKFLCDIFISGDKYRLTKFILTTYSSNGLVIQSYREPGIELLSYTVKIVDSSQPVSYLTIEASSDEAILTLCEVETYGDYLCPDGTWGLTCQETCSCEHTESCFQVTGKCSHGCPNGFYGPNCDKNCHGFCNESGCKERSGFCYECRSGYREEYCNEACPNGTYGTKCAMNCSENCENHECHPQTGACVLCPDRTFGTNCSQNCPPSCLDGKCEVQSGRCLSCPPRLYKDNCSALCIKNCTGDVCNQFTGFCGAGCPPGMYGESCQMFCEENCVICDAVTCFKCSDGLYGENCSMPCPMRCNENNCNMTDGKCLSCSPGFYGEECSTPCKGDCSEIGCDFISGHCSRSSLDYVYNSSSISWIVPALIGTIVLAAASIIFFWKHKSDQLADLSVTSNSGE